MSMSIGQKKVKPILCVESLTKQRPRLVHYVSEDLLCKEKTCPTRIRLGEPNRSMSMGQKKVKPILCVESLTK